MCISLVECNTLTTRYAALILAAAGIKRMGWSDRIGQFLGPETCLHAVGQGSIGIECLSDDASTIALVSVLNHHETSLCVDSIVLTSLK